MKHTECKDCKLREGDCGYHHRFEGVVNLDIPSLSSCDKYGNCGHFQQKETPKGDLISRSDLKEKLAKCGYDIVDFGGLFFIIDNAPTVCGNNPKWCESCVSKGKCASTRPKPEITDEDIQNAIKQGFNDGYEMAKAKYERPQGEWIEKGKYQFECNQCHYDDIAIKSTFCPNCGADMRGGGGDD